MEKVASEDITQVAKTIYPAHRWRDLHDYDAVSLWRPDSCFLAPDGVTVVPVYSDLLRASSVTEAMAGKPFYASDEFNRRLVKTDVRTDGTLANLRTFVKQGEFGSAVDREGRVYVADGHTYIWNKKGESAGVIRMPERPTSLVVGGEDGKTLFMAARFSLYRYKIAN